MGSLIRGLVSGAAGTTALNLATYMDMSVRARPASDVPVKTVEQLAAKVGVDLTPDASDDTKNRNSALGALSGYVVGLAIGAGYGAVRSHAASAKLPLAALGIGAAAMMASDVPSAALGVTDPKTWGPSGWVADIVPHLVYGIVTAFAFELLES